MESTNHQLIWHKHTNIQYYYYTLSLTTECYEALRSPPPTTTTIISVRNTAISSSCESHHSTILHQKSKDSLVRVGSTQVVSKPMILEPTQSMSTNIFIGKFERDKKPYSIVTCIKFDIRMYKIVHRFSEAVMFRIPGLISAKVAYPNNKSINP